jgi:hypothetical protein
MFRTNVAETEMSQVLYSVQCNCSVTRAVKVNLSPYLVNQLVCQKDIWGSGGIAPIFLNSALD